MLIATARELAAMLVTRDPVIVAYCAQGMKACRRVDAQGLLSRIEIVLPN